MLVTFQILIGEMQEHAFQRLIFVTMLAWEQPYTRDGGSQFLQDAFSFQVCFVNYCMFKSFL